jgi:hypothetical protein
MTFGLPRRVEMIEKRYVIHLRNMPVGAANDDLNAKLRPRS